MSNIGVPSLTRCRYYRVPHGAVVSPVVIIGLAFELIAGVEQFPNLASPPSAGRTGSGSHGA
jgi:hypothetical protein